MANKILAFSGLLASLLLVAGVTQAAPIAGTAGVMNLQDGPNTEGLFFEINVHYEAFDGTDAGDPLGVTPGKVQYAYILEYVGGNEIMRFFDVESINGVALIETATSTNSTVTVNGIEPGTAAPLVHMIVPFPSGNPAARFVYPTGFSGVGNKTVILVFTASNKFDVGLVLAQISDTSLGAAGEVAGPTECFGIVEGCVFCLDCGPDGEVQPMGDVTVKVLSDGNEVASAVTGENGQYEVSGLGTGQYTVMVDGDFAACSQGATEVEITCTSGAVASFCVCPPVCTQSICVSTVCDGNAVPAWVGIYGPKIQKWRGTGANGIKCFNGVNIVPGHYKVKVKAPCGYQVNGDSVVEFDLTECENKEVVFNVCPIPPCVQSACIKVVEQVDGNEIPVEGVTVKLKKCKFVKTGTTNTDGESCFDNLWVGPHVAIIEVPEGYRLCDGKLRIPFGLERCEHEDITFVLCKIELGPCPLSPGYWKEHPSNWLITEMWIGADYLEQSILLNILNGMKVDGSPANCHDMSIKLAKFLIAVKLNLAMGCDAKDINPVVVAADEFLLYDYPPGSNPRGKGKELARQLKNTLEEYILDNSYCNPVEP